MISGELLPFGVSSQFKIHFEVSRINSGIHLHFKLIGPTKEINWPEKKSQKRVEELWKSTCFELFAGPVGAQSYIEVNVSPTSEWDFYHLDSYRKGMRRVEQEGAINKILVNKGSDSGEVSFDLTHPYLADKNLEVSPTVVLQDKDGGITYWALQHKSDKPDFHWRSPHWRKI